MRQEFNEKFYLDHHGSKCPYCRGNDIEGVGSWNIDGEQAWQEIRCNVCECIWRDIYTLTGVEEIKN